MKVIRNNVYAAAFLAFYLICKVQSFSPTGCHLTTPPEKNDMVLAYQQDSGLKATECITRCQQGGRPYSGLLAGVSCSCGDEFGRTQPMIDCNYTCADKHLCGGVGSYSNYYVVDESNNTSRQQQLNPDLKTYAEARRYCIKANGDLLGRTIIDPSTQNAVTSLANNFSTPVVKIWLGLRQRDVEYEWVDEREPPQDNTYVKQKYLYSSLWNANDPNLKCVYYDVSSKHIGSLDCTTTLPFVCLYLPANPVQDTTTSPSNNHLTLDASGNWSSDNKTLALYIVLPLFFICYGGACILYCVHKIIRHCCRKGSDLGKHSKLASDPPSRPPSARKATVYPAPVMSEPIPVKYPAPSVPPSYPGKDAPTSARQIQPELEDPDRKKQLLLENAAREARERRQKELEEGKAARIFSGQKKEQPPPQPLEDDRPESSRSTTKLLPPPSVNREAPPPPQRPPQQPQQPQQPLPQQPQQSDPQQNMAGMSINEILRNKMAQQANKKKPKKILAA